jgi:hypothetical protein
MREGLGRFDGGAFFNSMDCEGFENTLYLSKNGLSGACQVSD